MGKFSTNPVAGNLRERERASQETAEHSLGGQSFGGRDGRG